MMIDNHDWFFVQGLKAILGYLDLVMTLKVATFYWFIGLKWWPLYGTCIDAIVETSKFKWGWFTFFNWDILVLNQNILSVETERGDWNDSWEYDEKSIA